MSIVPKTAKPCRFSFLALLAALSLLLVTIMPSIALAQGGEGPSSAPAAQEAAAQPIGGEAQEWYLAEGYTGGDFDTWVLVQNPGEENTDVTLEFQLPPGTSADPHSFNLPAKSRVSVHLDELPGLAGTDVSTKVTATKPIIVERSVYFNYNGKTGGHDSVGVKYPSNAWYLAEGYTGGDFDTWVLVQNPGTANGFVTLDFQLPPGSSAPSYQFELPAGTRRSIHLDDLPGLADTDISTKVSGTVPVVAERAMYFNYEGKDGGSDSAGAERPSKSWYLAEGYTGGQFDTWVLVQNPGDEEAVVTMSFQLPPGSSASPIRFQLAAHTRQSIHLDLLPGLADTDVSTTVESDKPVVAERAMYFNYEGKTDGHDSTGALSPSPFWFLAEGYTGGDFDTWVLVQNPGETDKHVTLEFQLPPGSSANPISFQLAAGTRQSIHLDKLPGLESTDVSTLVASDGPVVAERAMYFNYNGKDGGSCSIGALFEPPIIPDTTKILSADDMKHLESVAADGDYAKLTFNSDLPTLQNVKAGDIIVSGPSGDWPYGMLQKVVTIKRGEGQVFITTASASFEEAVWRGHITATSTLTPAQVASTHILDDAVQYQGADVAGGDSYNAAATMNLPFNYNINNLHLGTGSNYVNLNGHINLNIAVTFNVDIDVTWPSVDWQVHRHSYYGIPYWTVDIDVTPPSVSLNSMDFSAAFSENVQLNVSGNVNLNNLEYEKDIVEHEFTPITFSVGPVPVVLVPYVNLHAGVDGKVSAGISIDVTQGGSVSAGCAYSGGNWTATPGHSFSFDWSKPTGSLNADFKVYAGPQLGIKLYGVCGPYVNIEPYVRLVINTAQPPLWSVYVGVDLDLGVKAEVQIGIDVDIPHIGNKSWSWTKTIFDKQWPGLLNWEMLLANAVKINAISPDSGPVGTEVTIDGSGFGDTRENNSYVTFGSVPATEYTAWGASQIKCKVPGGVAVGALELRVVHIFHDWTIGPLRIIIQVESNTKTFTVTPGGGAGTELLTNGDFSGQLSGWQIIDQGGTKYHGTNITEILTEGGDRYVHMYRRCPEKDGGGAGLKQGLNANLPGGTLTLSAEVRCDYQNGGAIAGSNPAWYPEGAVQFRIVYRRPDNSTGEWYHGFYYGNVPGADTAHFTQVPRGSWMNYTSGNILSEIGAGATILEFRVYGFGWDFDGFADTISLRSGT